MSERIKLFIYTDVKTDRVLLLKRSTKFSFFMNLEGIRVQVLSTKLDLPKVTPLKDTFAPKSGFKKAGGKISKLEQVRLKVLQRKVEVAILIFTSLQLMREDIKTSFTNEVLDKTPLSEENFKRYWLFMAEEKKILFARIQRFRKKFFAQMNSAESLSQVDALYEYLKANVNLGVYSAMNRERKDIGGK